MEYPEGVGVEGEAGGAGLGPDDEVEGFFRGGGAGDDESLEAGEVFDFLFDAAGHLAELLEVGLEDEGVDVARGCAAGTGGELMGTQTAKRMSSASAGRRRALGDRVGKRSGEARNAPQSAAQKETP